MSLVTAVSLCGNSVPGDSLGKLRTVLVQQSDHSLQQWATCMTCCENNMGALARVPPPLFLRTPMCHHEASSKLYVLRSENVPPAPSPLAT